jgi:hypothetical protein
MSVHRTTVTAHEQRSALGRHRRHKFREGARTTDNPTTKLQAEGMTALAEAVREFDDKPEKVDQQVRSSTVG